MERTITIAKHNADLEVKKTEERRIDLEHKASLRQKEELYQHQIEMDKKDQERKNQELIQRHELRLKEIQSKETSDLSCSVQ